MIDIENTPVLGTLKRFAQWRESTLETWAIFLTLTGIQIIGVAQQNIRNGQHTLGFVNLFGSMFGAIFAMFLLRRAWILFIIAVVTLLIANGGVIHI